MSFTAKQFHCAFGNAPTDDESNYLHDKWTIPGQGRTLFEYAAANFVKNSPAKVDTHLVDRGPLLLTSGTEDHTVPLKVTNSLAMDYGWRDVADVALEWFARKGF